MTFIEQWGKMQHLIAMSVRNDIFVLSAVGCDPQIVKYSCGG